MTFYTFDWAGWYLGTSDTIPDDGRYTTTPTPSDTLATGQQWQWAFGGWSAQTYVVPIIPAPTPQPTTLTPLQFVALILSTANISYATLGTTITSNATMQGLWAMLQLATSISYGDALTTAALAELVTLNVLTAAQVTAINAAWPVA